MLSLSRDEVDDLLFDLVPPELRDERHVREAREKLARYLSGLEDRLLRLEAAVSPKEGERA